MKACGSQIKLKKDYILALITRGIGEEKRENKEDNKK